MVDGYLGVLSDNFNCNALLGLRLQNTVKTPFSVLETRYLDMVLVDAISTSLQTPNSPSLLLVVFQVIV